MNSWITRSLLTLVLAGGLLAWTADDAEARRRGRCRGRGAVCVSHYSYGGHCCGYGYGGYGWGGSQWHGQYGNPGCCGVASYGNVYGVGYGAGCGCN